MKRLLAILSFIVVMNEVKAQSDTSVMSIAIPDRMRVGTVVGAVFSPSVRGINGFTFGINTEYSVAKKIVVRPQLLCSSLMYKVRPDAYMERVVVEIPLHVYYRPFEWKISPYAGGGASCKIDLRAAQSAFYGEACMGFEIRLPYAAVSPEVRYSYGRDMQFVYCVLNLKSIW